MFKAKNFRLLLITTLISSPIVYANPTPINKSLLKQPQEVALAFERHFNAANVNGLLALYSDNGIFVPQPKVQLNQPQEIRQALNQFMSMKLPIKVHVRQVYQSDDIALIISDWSIIGKDPSGKPVNLKGTGADVVKRDADGAWRYVIDNPFGVALPNSEQK
ncbi:YybH family protein [Acinetobacter guillouiae]|uniref:YybH family protein n=1 Tax=Acinetobacter guillouiae TaxID=106649 RepID=UPI00300B4E7D